MSIHDETEADTRAERIDPVLAAAGARTAPRFGVRSYVLGAPKPASDGQSLTDPFLRKSSRMNYHDCSAFFCNIGWMSHYEGLKGKPDNIVGGGKHVDTHKHGHEACNFLTCDDGNVYGYVDRSTKREQLPIRLERITDTETVDKVDGVDIGWVATHSEQGGRRVVGWYRDATVFRMHQVFPRKLSKQHDRDDIDQYRIRAKATNVHKLDIHDRTLTLGTGKGWFGQANIWFADDDSNEGLAEFLNATRQLINTQTATGGSSAEEVKGNKPEGGSASSASDPYVRYVVEHEATISPKHSDLQDRFASFVKDAGGKDIEHNIAFVDFRYEDQNRGLILAEIKPCDVSNARFAIRTAMGQLLDYNQNCPTASRLLIVLEVKPKGLDILLATSNGFGLAFPAGETFEVIWSRDLE